MCLRLAFFELFGKVLQPHETLDFQGLFRNQNCAFLLNGTIVTFIIYRCNTYGIRLSHTFEIPGISNKKTQYFNRNTLEFRSKQQVFRIGNFEILGFSHLEFEILGIPRKIPGISKTWNFDRIAGAKNIIMSFGCFCLFQTFGLNQEKTKRRIKKIIQIQSMIS